MKSILEASDAVFFSMQETRGVSGGGGGRLQAKLGCLWPLVTMTWGKNGPHNLNLFRLYTLGQKHTNIFLGFIILISEF